MNTVETINQKVMHLPPRAQEEVLDAVEGIEQRYRTETNGENDRSEEGVLDLLSEIRIEGPTDLASRHDFYAHGKLEE